jgi:hypothetical protein
MLVKITTILVAALVFVLIVDPGDLLFHMKVPLFASILVFWIGDKIISKRGIKFDKDISIFIPLLLLIPVLGFISGLVQSQIDDMEAALGFVKSFIIIILLYVVIDLTIPIDKYLIRFSIIIPLIIFPSYFILVYNPGLFQTLGVFLVDVKNVAVFSLRDFYGYKVIMLFYRTSPLLVFPLTYFFDRALRFGRSFDYLLFGVYFATLILSGTRANIVIAVLLPLVMFFFFLLRRRKFIFLSAISFLVVYFAVVFLSNISNEKGDESSDIKSKHYNSIIKVIKAEPSILIWGQGLGSKYFSTGTNSEIVQSELTYLELIRVFGILLTLLFLFILIYPLVVLQKSGGLKVRYAIYAYLGYLFIVGTNPLLISSTGMIVIIVVYTLSYNTKKQIIVNKNLN